MNTLILYRPVNQVELHLIKESGMKEFPQRLPQQPFFYPVTNLEYAKKITKDWNLPAYGNGFVVRFEVNEMYMQQYTVQNVGGVIHNEYWIPAEELIEFNKNIIGQIEVIYVYPEISGNI